MDLAASTHEHNGTARILVVEDERLVAVDVKHRLKRLGYEIARVVADGAGAIAATAELSPDLILMDIGLQGGMDGIEAASQISKRSDVPIVFVTANADDKVLQRALNGNAVGYVLKPFRDREIVVSIEMALYKARTERKLREARWWTENTLETISEGVVAADHLGVIRYMNASAELLCGWSRDEATGCAVDEVLKILNPEEYHDSDLLLSTEPDMPNTAFFARRVLIKTKNDSRVPLEIVERVLYSPDGKPCGTVYSLKDIGENLRYEGELRSSREEALAALRSRSEFVANMSHELRTPLNSIIGMSELALERAESQEQREFLRILRNSGDSLLNLINGILDYSKIEAGRMKITDSEFELLELFQVCLEHVAAQAHKKKVRVIQMLPVALAGKIKTDKQKLKQIILNLLSNAVKFTEGGEIVLSAVADSNEAGEEGLEIVVSDTGIGIPPEKLDSVFEAFTQIDGSATRHYGGTGIGLAITKSMVELLGGRISVESKAQRGSSFRVFLPILPSSYPVSVRKKLNRKTVRVMSTSQHELNYLEDWLGQAGMELRQSENLVELRADEERGDPSDFVLVLGLRGKDAEDASSLTAGATGIPAFVSLPIAGPARGTGVRKTGFVLNEPVRVELLLHRLETALGVAHETETEAQAGSSTQSSTAGSKESSLAIPGSKRLSVLLVDDDNINRLVNAKVLEQLGHTVIKAENGRLAVERLRRMQADLVLMDLEMPEMDGFAAAAAIRKGEAGEHVSGIPIIAVTAHTADSDRRRVFAEGMNAMLVKPFAMESLAQVIHEVVKGPLVHEQPAEPQQELVQKPSEATIEQTKHSEYDAALRAYLKDMVSPITDFEEIGRRSSELRRLAKQRGASEIDNLMFRVILACRREDENDVTALWRELEGATDEISGS